METCTTSDTTLPTWYRTLEFSSRAGDRDVEPRTAVMPARSAATAGSAGPPPGSFGPPPVAASVEVRDQSPGPRHVLLIPATERADQHGLLGGDTVTVRDDHQKGDG